MLYDEPHPLGDDIGTIQTADLGRKPDMLIIMGTSLKVHGFKKLVKEFARSVHQSAPTGVSTAVPNRTPIGKTTAKSHAGKVIFVNKTPPGAEWEGIIDYWVQGESDRWVEKVVEDWKKMLPADWEVQKTLDEVPAEKGGFQVMKQLNGATGKGKGKGKRKENIPPDDISLAMSTPLPPSPPASPSKRRTAMCHYAQDDEGDCQPSKKRAQSRLRGGEEDLDDLPGMLFTEASGSRIGKAGGVEDGFLAPERSRPKSRAGAKGGATGKSVSTVAKARSVSRSKATKSTAKSKLGAVAPSRRGRAATAKGR